MTATRGWVNERVVLEHPVLGVKSEVHVRPVGDLRPHSYTPGCPCGGGPLPGDEGVVVHNAFDGREIIERVEAGLAP